MLNPIIRNRIAPGKPEMKMLYESRIHIREFKLRRELSESIKKVRSEIRGGQRTDMLSGRKPNYALIMFNLNKQKKKIEQSRADNQLNPPKAITRRLVEE